MRTLNRNKTVLYVVEPSSYVDEVDSDGNFTGEKQMVQGATYQIEIMIYPSNGYITEKLFGTEQSFDCSGVTDTIDIPKGSLLYNVLPTSNFDTTFDYKVDAKQKSINGFLYGLVGNKWVTQ